MYHTIYIPCCLQMLMMKPTLALEVEPTHKRKDSNDMQCLDSQGGDSRLYRGMG